MHIPLLESRWMPTDSAPETQDGHATFSIGKYHSEQIHLETSHHHRLIFDLIQRAYCAGKQDGMMIVKTAVDQALNQAVL